jgi:hypothetical protein
MMPRRRNFVGVIVYPLSLMLFSLGHVNLRRSSFPAAGRRIESGQVSRAERRLGPFEIGKTKFTIILQVQKIEGAPDGFEETVESLTILDDRAGEHFRKSFEVQVAGRMFRETVGLSAFALESSGGKPLRAEADGLLLYYGYIPSAPSSGQSCQVFRLVDGRLTPTSPPLTVYGRIHDLEEGSRPEAKKLAQGETMVFGVWTGWFEVLVPVRVLDGLRVIPLHRDLTFGLDVFSVAVERLPQDQETFVRLFRSPEDTAPAHVIVRKTSKVEFLQAYTRVGFDTEGGEVAVSAGEMPWLKVRIDGQEGFVKDEEDLAALGLQPAG